MAAFLPVAEAWVGLTGATVLLIDFVVLEPWGLRMQTRGANIQELFDTRLFGLQWNSVRVDAKPTPELVADRAAKYGSKPADTARLLNWYPPDAGTVPLEYGRLLCQRANAAWDARLHHRFAALLSWSAAALVTVGLFWALAAHYAMERIVLSLIVPALPLLVQLMRARQKHLDAAKDGDRVRAHLDDVWGKMVNGELSPAARTYEARNVQDSIYLRRKNAPMVPSWLYHRARESYETQMQAAAAQLAAEARRALSERRGHDVS